MAIHAAKLDALRRVRRNGGVPTFFDSLVLAVPESAEDDRSSSLRQRITSTLEAAQQGFVDPLSRLDLGVRTDVTAYVRSCSQGTETVGEWMGRALFKSVFDLGVYQQLMQRVRPRTVIEIGSGTGASALWFRSMGLALGLTCRVLSVDLAPPPAVDDEGVTFLAGDAADLEGALTADVLSMLPRPWLVVEDAHVHVPKVLRFFDRQLRGGDCLVIEDSRGKQDCLRDFLVAGTEAVYLADSALIDFYGINATSAVNSIWRVREPAVLS
ncbi:CmcI family methyltransferase [Streptomyces sp. NBC_01262]|uniref:CmcI family methyltransferase n=1 Tax=Streptomyces sp. NBC_01262 TaxID=2903803 RepID=UPI002E3686BC|nr:CmcI family methyltransferase [Streptomyces sp. NBC_01262]